MEKNKILTICKMAAQITDEEVAEVREIIKSQMAYCNPLRMGTSGRLHDLGMHNQATLNAVLNLKSVIDNGADI